MTKNIRIAAIFVLIPALLGVMSHFSGASFTSNAWTDIAIRLVLGATLGCVGYITLRFRHGAELHSYF